MTKLKIELNYKAIGDLLKSQEVIDELMRIGNSMKNQAGNGYGIDSYIGKNRANVSIYPVTRKARKDNYSNNTLVKCSRSFKE